MSAKHDKGPWLAQRWSDSHRDYNIHAEDGGIIALVSGRCGELAESDAANARLIAAAPELLEALEAMVQEYGRRYGESDKLMDSEFQNHVIKPAMEALAKAAGKEESK